ncbi:MAG: hypothetical protein ACPGXZ_15960, partial [Saprospiraceae bacterium]
MLQRIVLSLTLLLTFSALYSQNAEIPTNVNELENLNNLNRVTSMSGEVFFTDPDNKVYYIDFEATKSQVIQIQLWQNQEVLVKNESTDKLPYNTIFELKIEDLAPGEYSIELTTIDDDS